jgi:hypothetical protein
MNELNKTGSVMNNKSHFGLAAAAWNRDRGRGRLVKESTMVNNPGRYPAGLKVQSAPARFSPVSCLNYSGSFQH